MEQNYLILSFVGPKDRCQGKIKDFCGLRRFFSEFFRGQPVRSFHSEKGSN